MYIQRVGALMRLDMKFIYKLETFYIFINADQVCVGQFIFIVSFVIQLRCASAPEYKYTANYVWFIADHDPIPHYYQY